VHLQATDLLVENEEKCGSILEGPAALRRDQAEEISRQEVAAGDRELAVLETEAGQTI